MTLAWVVGTLLCQMFSDHKLVKVGDEVIQQVPRAVLVYLSPHPVQWGWT